MEFKDYKEFAKEFPSFNEIVFLKLKLAQLYYDKNEFSKALDIYREIRFQETKISKITVDLLEVSDFFKNNWNVLDKS